MSKKIATGAKKRLKRLAAYKISALKSKSVSPASNYPILCLMISQNHEKIVHNKKIG